jgi:hypothetical protein
VIDGLIDRLFCSRLDRRGWTLSSSPREAATDSGGAGAGASGGKVVVLKSKKKRMMDQEHYLDATQRYVRRRVCASKLFFSPVRILLLANYSLFFFFFGLCVVSKLEFRGVMRAVQASTFGAPAAAAAAAANLNGAGNHHYPPAASSVVGGLRAGEGLLPRALQRVGGGASDSGAGTGATSIVDESLAAGTASSSDHDRHPHIHQVRRYGHSLKGHVESWLVD